MTTALPRSPRVQRFSATSMLIIAASAAWLGVLALARDMGPMPGTMGLSPAGFAGVWFVMMAAMMLPSITPFAALYTRTFGDERRRRLVGFLGGYLAVWFIAVVPAYALAELTDRTVPGHESVARVFAVTLFVTCGVYQLTPLKDRCLAHCRSPLGFVLKFANYRGRTRDLRVGAHHGMFCLGCCWALMGLLIAFGLMNVLAMLALATVVLLEKSWRWGPALARGTGVVALILAVLVGINPGLVSGLDPAVSPGQMGDMG